MSPFVNLAIDFLPVSPGPHTAYFKITCTSRNSYPFSYCESIPKNGRQRTFMEAKGLTTLPGYHH
eukprot:1006498-Rhodomonas_salina.1